MYAFLSFIHVLDCVLLIVVVLLQSSRGGGLSAAFGGAGTQAIFGGRGAGTFLSRATSVLAVIFMLTSLTLTLYGGPTGTRKSALAEQAKKEGVAQPFVPETATPQPLGGAGGPGGAPGAAGEPGAPAGTATEPAAGTGAQAPSGGAQTRPPAGSAQTPPPGGPGGG